MLKPPCINYVALGTAVVVGTSVIRPDADDRHMDLEDYSPQVYLVQPSGIAGVTTAAMPQSTSPGSMFVEVF